MAATYLQSSLSSLAGQQLSNQALQLTSHTSSERRPVQPVCVATGRNHRCTGESGESHMQRGVVGGRRSGAPAIEAMPWLISSSSDSAPAKNQWWGQLFQFSSDPWSGLVPEAAKTEVASQLSKTQQLDAAISSQYDSIPTKVALKKATPSVPKGSARSSIMSQDWRGVRFTAQKAQNLRKQLKGTDTWHDIMYHSGLAARLAEGESS